MLTDYPLRAEHAIVESWVGSEILVSIVCITYNQESYIADAIKGFLIQETSFPFEIIIHDDASSDRTPAIIRSYEALYPNLIKPIYQSTNQFRRNARFPMLTSVQKSVGSYVALCEGDDYWCDPKKLEIQFHAMRKNNAVMLSFHPAHVLKGDTLTVVESNQKYEIKLVSAKYIISKGGGACPTVSLMVKRQIFDSLPKWFMQAPVADYYLQCLAASTAGALRISEPMAVYRAEAKGSVTVALLESSSDELLENLAAKVESNYHLADELNGQFREDVDKYSVSVMFQMSIVLFKRGHYRQCFICWYRSSKISGRLFLRVLFADLMRRAQRFIGGYSRQASTKAERTKM